jgi:DNA-3-methyladenine glycosylase I
MTIMIITAQASKETEMTQRCGWCGSDPLYQAYHDEEWGVPVHDDYRLFEYLVLEGAQAGLSWLTILKKRERYRIAFDHFDFRKIAAYRPADIRRLLNDRGIVRNRLKIESALKNARAALAVIDQFGSLDTYFWQFMEGKPLHNQWRTVSEIPARTSLSDKISKELKRHGFSFVGSTICYAFMQAVGMVNDHTIDCFRHDEIRKLDHQS